MMPEEMPTPKKSLKELERTKKKLENNDQKKLELNENSTSANYTHV